MSIRSPLLPAETPADVTRLRAVGDRARWEVIEGERKLVAQRGRLTHRIERWSPDLAREFGRFCARRTRERVGFLPFLSGFVADVDRFVAQNRIAIAGFAAARAAELRDGAAAYESERRAQAGWLAERLGLEQPIT